MAGGIPKNPIFARRFIEDGCHVYKTAWAPLSDLYSAFLDYYPGMKKSKIDFSKDLTLLGFKKCRGRKTTTAGKFNGVYFEGLTPK